MWIITRWWFWISLVRCCYRNRFRRWRWSYLTRVFQDEKTCRGTRHWLNRWTQKTCVTAIRVETIAFTGMVIWTLIFTISPTRNCCVWIVKIFGCLQRLICITKRMINGAILLGQGLVQRYIIWTLFRREHTIFTPWGKFANVWVAQPTLLFIRFEKVTQATSVHST